jgi:hypothetical protein
MDRLAAVNSDNESFNHLQLEYELLQMVGRLLPMTAHVETLQTPQMEEVTALRDGWDILREQIEKWRSGLRRDFRECAASSTES